MDIMMCLFDMLERFYETDEIEYSWRGDDDILDIRFTPYADERMVDLVTTYLTYASSDVKAESEDKGEYTIEEYIVSVTIER